MPEMIITEKPSAAKMIAFALADDKVNIQKNKTVKYYEIKHSGKKIFVVCAVGHLFTVAEKKKSFRYPSFDIQWKPVYETSKKAKYAKKYADTIKKVAKKADSFTVGCDFDIEGEVIGLNVVRFALKRKDASRMKFSTLTKPDLVKVFRMKVSVSASSPR